MSERYTSHQCSNSSKTRVTNTNFLGRPALLTWKIGLTIFYVPSIWPWEKFNFVKKNISSVNGRLSINHYWKCDKNIKQQQQKMTVWMI